MNPNEVSRPGGYIKFIAYLQIIGIILVVAGHSLHEYPDGHNGTQTLFYKAVYSFHMPLFLFVSGLLLVYSTRICESAKYSFGKFAINKIKRLLLPYAVLTTITFVPRAMMSGMADDVIQLSLPTFFRAFLYVESMPIPYFWYLQVCFIMLLLVYGILMVVKRYGGSLKATILALTILFSAIYFIEIDFPSIFCLDRLRLFGLWLVLGSVYGIWHDSIDKYIPWNNIYFLIASIMVWMVSFYLFIETDFQFVIALLGIIMCVSLAKIIDEKEWRFLNHLMDANYIIFLLSWYANVVFQQVLAHFVELPWWVHTALSLIAGIYVPWLAYKYLQRHQQSRWVKVTAFLLGQSFRKKDAKH